MVSGTGTEDLVCVSQADRGCLLLLNSKFDLILKVSQGLLRHWGDKHSFDHRILCTVCVTSVN